MDPPRSTAGSGLPRDLLCGDMAVARVDGSSESWVTSRVASAVATTRPGDGVRLERLFGIFAEIV